MTTYLIVRSDARYSHHVETHVIRSFLEQNTPLISEGAAAFRAPAGFSVSRVQLAMANGCGSYCSDGSLLPFSNVVESIVSDESDGVMESVARKLAEFLDWEFVEQDH